MRARTIAAALAAIAVLGLPPRTARAQAYGGIADVLRLRAVPATFRFAPEARAGFDRLWEESTMARAERVACVGGRRDGDEVLIDRVLWLEPTQADSLSISAQPSIDTCGPPEWLGTVHTHVAVQRGERPFPLLSGADRGIIRLWWRKWREDGVFCVVSGRQDPYCELDAIAPVPVEERRAASRRTRRGDADPSVPYADTRRD